MSLVLRQVDCRFGTVILLTTLTSFTAGCAHTQLRNNTVKQADTLSDVYQQQVLNNLAMFVHDIDSLPHFAVPTNGISQLSDTGSSGASWTGPINGIIVGLFGFTINGNVSRSATNSWGLTPISDSHKLSRMRCAYQYAAKPHSCGGHSANCPNCSIILATFFESNVNQAEKTHEQATGSEKSSGHPSVTPDLACIESLGDELWLGVGGKGNVPASYDYINVGHYRDLYVWVLPGHRDKLTTLTLAILDFAFREPPIPTTKSVTFHLDAHKLPVPQNESVITVTETVSTETDERTLWFDRKQIDGIDKLRMKGFDIIGLAQQSRKLFHRYLENFVTDSLNEARINELLQQFEPGDPRHQEAYAFLNRVRELQTLLKTDENLKEDVEAYRRARHARPRQYHKGNIAAEHLSAGQTTLELKQQLDQLK